MESIKDKQHLKRNIPALIYSIAKEDDPEIIGFYENTMVSVYSSVILLFAAIANFAVKYFLKSESLLVSLLTTAVFLFLAVAFEAAIRINIKTKDMNLVVSLLSAVSLVYVCVVYYNSIGPAVWTVAFIIILMAMIRITKTMIYFLVSALCVSGVFVFYSSFYSPSFQLNIIYHSVQIVLFLVLFFVAAAVHRINVNRYETIRFQYQEVIKDEQQIKSLYDQLAISEKRNKYLAYHDVLTSLPNRLLLIERLNQAINLANDTKKLLGVLFLDIDNFKIINDVMGHEIGDHLLVETSKRLMEIVGKQNTVARIGGDEFIILIDQAENMEDIQRIPEKIVNIMQQQPFNLKNNQFFITTSIGISVYPMDGNTGEMLIRNADHAMYQAKASGGNQYEFCTEALKNKSMEGIKLSRFLFKAIERNEMELYYQPQVNPNTGKIIGLEALLRWNSPELGPVLPAEFIPVAEKSGQIISIGEWVLRTACQQNKTWQDMGLWPVPVSVNLSPRQFQDYRLVQKLEDVLTQTGLDPHYLEIEITENIVMQNTDYVIKTLESFRKMGISIAIDDFGKKYSSMNYLKQMPVDKIKIDMSFIHGINLNSKDEAITKAIIILGKSLGLRVVAEGVETKPQLSFLTQRMCDEIQGYYYYKPMPASEVEELLRSIGANTP